MKVKVHVVALIIEEKERKLTKAVARQFPIRYLNKRMDDLYGDKLAPPLAKVAGKVLGSEARWLYLVKDEEAGLAWEPAAMLWKKAERDRAAAGLPLEIRPSDVPTIIL